MKSVWLKPLSMLLLICILTPPIIAADRMEPAPADIKDVTVIEQLESQIPLDLQFKNERGNTVELKDFFNHDKPVIMTFNFFQCPMLCHLILDGLVSSLQNMSLEPGTDFDILSVSFDPLDTPTIAQAWKQKYVKQYGKPSSASGWHFLTGKKKDITALTDSVGYYYQYVKERQEYAHIAAMLVLMPDGKVSRYIYGIEYNPQTLRLSLVEASEGKIGNTLDKIILTCYYYDHTKGKYAPLAVNVMRIGGGLTVLVLGIFLLTLWIREKNKATHNAEEVST
jgi:protein SCO1/2